MNIQRENYEAFKQALADARKAIAKMEAAYAPKNAFQDAADIIANSLKK